MKKQIALVEAHDSRLEAMTVRPGGSVVLLLARLGVYVPRDSRHYDIWSHGATLRLEGVTDLHVTGPIPDDGWIAIVGLACRFLHRARIHDPRECRVGIGRSDFA